MKTTKYALIMGRINPAKEAETIERLWQLDQIDEVQTTIGKFDFIAKIHFDNFENFFDAYLQVKRIPEIHPIKVLVARSNGSEL